MCILKTLIVAAACAMTLAAHAQTTLTFEGSTTTGASRILDTDGANAHGPSLLDYAGYDWIGMAVSKPNVSVGRPQQIVGFENDPEDGPTPVTAAVDAGFHRSIVSGDTVAYTQSFAGASSLFASIKARDGAANFNFLSTWMTAGWRDAISVTVTGLLDGNALYTNTFTIGDDAPTLIDLDYMNIDEIRFSSAGGSFLYPNGSGIGGFVNPSNAFSTPVLVFDDMTIAAVPEPSTILLMLVGLAVCAGLGRRAQRDRA